MYIIIITINNNIALWTVKLQMYVEYYIKECLLISCLSFVRPHFVSGFIFSTLYHYKDILNVDNKLLKGMNDYTYKLQKLDLYSLGMVRIRI